MSGQGTVWLRLEICPEKIHQTVKDLTNKMVQWCSFTNEKVVGVWIRTYQLDGISYN